MEETAHQEDAQHATAEPPKEWKTSPHGAPNIHGTRHAANASFPTKAEEMPTP